jgi:predicted nucleotidyltransferase
MNEVVGKSENINMELKTRFSHPVSDEVRQQVVAELRKIEVDHDVDILFACESGSRAWGFASPDSDYDVRFIYKHRPEWYLTVKPGRDVIEIPISDELDINGWDLKKALGLLLASNPTLFEWINSPIVYEADATFVETIRSLSNVYFSNEKGYHHYVSMARKNFRGYLQGETVRTKKYLYVLRPLLAARWIKANLGIPPMRFATLVDTLLVDQAPLTKEIDQLLEIKMAQSEAEYGPRYVQIHHWIENELSSEDSWTGPYHHDKDVALLDQVMRDFVLSDRR